MSDQERLLLLQPRNSSTIQDNIELSRHEYERLEFSQAAGKTQQADGKPGLGIIFFVRLWKILVILRPYHIVFVALLSLGEAYFIYRVGKVQGQYYSIYLRDDRRAFGRTTGMSLLTYGGALAFTSSAEWLSKFLAVKWRKKLGTYMHNLYCNKMKFYWLKYNEVQIDNPDQRLTDDLKQLCDVLGELTYKLSAVPFTLALYTYLVVDIYTIWTPVFIAAGFCIVGLLVQRTVMVKIACLVFQQERLEGNFRKGHMRLRDEGESVALYKDWRFELAHIDGQLQNAVKNQYRIVMWKWLLIAITKGFEYTGATLNFAILALAVFGGVWTSFDNAQLAQHISNASFFTLTFIYTFTKLLDAADNISKMAGLLARVTQLMEELQQIQIPNTSTNRWSLDGHRNQDFSQNNQVVVCCEHPAWHYKTQALELMPAFKAICKSSFEMEISVHSLGHDALLQEVQKCFPDSPTSSGLLAVVTMQRGKIQDMDDMLRAFMEWEAAMYTQLRAFWCNAVNPCNGLALRGKTGKRYSEVFGAQVLLGYNKVTVNGCDMLQHPSYGCDVYPATFFTNAPLPVLKRVLQLINNEIPQYVSTQQTCNSTDPSNIALILEDITLYTPSQKLALKYLSLKVIRGTSLLINGPSGSGKTTLVKALCDLWHFESGRALFLPKYVGQDFVSEVRKGDVAFLPQCAVCAPGGSLRDQLTYPKTVHNANVENVVLRRLLKVVHLEYLLDQVEGDLDANANWISILSPGELQKLSIARILLLKPSVVVMDEATSALPQITENQLITKIQSEGITIIYVGHRSSLDKYFEQKLVLHDDGEGSWSLNSNKQLQQQN